MRRYTSTYTYYTDYCTSSFSSSSSNLCSVFLFQVLTLGSDSVVRLWDVLLVLIHTTYYCTSSSSSSSSSSHFFLFCLLGADAWLGFGGSVVGRAQDAHDTAGGPTQPRIKGYGLTRTLNPRLTLNPKEPPNHPTPSPKCSTLALPRVHPEG